MSNLNSPSSSSSPFNNNNNNNNRSMQGAKASNSGDGSYHTPTRVNLSSTSYYTPPQQQQLYLSPSSANHAYSNNYSPSINPNSNINSIPYETNHQHTTLAYGDDPYNDELPTQYSLSSMISHSSVTPQLSNRSSTHHPPPPPPSYHEALNHQPINVSSVSPHRMNTSSTPPLPSSSPIIHQQQQQQPSHHHHQQQQPQVAQKLEFQSKSNFNSPSTSYLSPANQQDKKMYSQSWSEPPSQSYHLSGGVGGSNQQPHPSSMYHDVFVRRLNPSTTTNESTMHRLSTPQLCPKQPATLDLYNTIVNLRVGGGADNNNNGINTTESTLVPQSPDSFNLRKEKDLMGINKEMEKSSSKNAIHPAASSATGGVGGVHELIETSNHQQTTPQRPDEEILYDMYLLKNRVEELRKELASKGSKTRKACWNVTSVGLDLIEILVTVLLVNFCVASFWRGTWVLMESYITFGGTSPTRAALVNLVYLAIGVAIVSFTQILSVLVTSQGLHTQLYKYWKKVRESFRDSDRAYHKMQPKVLGLCTLLFLWLIEKLHVYFAAIGCVFCWRGVFGIWDSYIAVYMDSENRIASGWLSHVLGLVVVLMFGVMNSLVTAPANTTNDRMMSFSGFVGSKWNFITNSIKERKNTNKERKILKECARRSSDTSNQQQ